MTCVCVQVCDQPHPLIIRSIVTKCIEGELDEALAQLNHLWGLGYSAVDIVSTVFRVVKNMDVPEITKLEFIKAHLFHTSFFFLSFIYISLSLCVCVCSFFFFFFDS